MFSKILIVACVCASWAASFFGPSLITKSEKGLSVQGQKVELASLLQEWCQHCGYQCIIQHDMKQKVSLDIEHASCQALQNHLLKDSDFEVSEEGVTRLFKKKSKGHWRAHIFHKRHASSVASHVKSLLSPAGMPSRSDAQGISLLRSFCKEYNTL